MLLQDEAESADHTVVSLLVSPITTCEDGEERPKDEPNTLTDTAPDPGELVLFKELNTGTIYDTILVELPKNNPEDTPTVPRNALPDGALH
jgi:hypothetical protein